MHSSAFAATIALGTIVLLACSSSSSSTPTQDAGVDRPYCQCLTPATTSSTCTDALQQTGQCCPTGYPWHQLVNGDWFCAAKGAPDSDPRCASVCPPGTNVGTGTGTNGTSASGGVCTIDPSECPTLCGSTSGSLSAPQTCVGRDCSFWVARACCLSTQKAFACVQFAVSGVTATCVAASSSCPSGTGLTVPCSNFGGPSAGSRCGTQVPDSECGGSMAGYTCCRDICGNTSASWLKGAGCCVTTCDGTSAADSQCDPSCNGRDGNAGSVCKHDSDCCPGKGLTCISGVCNVACRTTGQSCSTTQTCCAKNANGPLLCDSATCCNGRTSSCTTSADCCSGLDCVRGSTGPGRCCASGDFSCYPSSGGGGTPP